MFLQFHVHSEGLMRQQCSACAIGIDNVRALHVASFAVAEGHLALLPPPFSEMAIGGKHLTR
jgi:hypothetical protein